MRLVVIVLMLGISLAASIPARAACFDLTKGEPRELTGRLGFRIFPGPPGYADVQKGDTPEPAYVLTLDRPICLAGDDFADPELMFREVQLVPTEASVKKLAAAKGTIVTVLLGDRLAAHTGHHHRPLVAWVDDVFMAKDITEEYGTGASTVRAFYYALGAGDGAAASAFVVAEKRAKGPFSPGALSRFYGSLVEPLELLDVSALGAGRYRVRYRFTSGAGRCDGLAEVTTTKRGGRFYIQRIRALNGC